jgi:hypothetical protein
MVSLVNKKLKQHDWQNIILEEEYFANKQHCNLRLNPNFEEDIYVNDQFVAIEEEEEAINPPAGRGNNNNIGVNPPVGRDPPTNQSPTNPLPQTPPSTPPDPPTADDHRKKPRKGKHLTLLKLIQDQSDQFIKPTKYLKAAKIWIAFWRLQCLSLFVAGQSVNARYRRNSLSKFKLPRHNNGGSMKPHLVLVQQTC